MTSTVIHAGFAGLFINGTAYALVFIYVLPRAGADPDRVRWETAERPTDTR